MRSLYHFQLNSRREFVMRYDENEALFEISSGDS
jgi:hypothetical protein